MIGKRGGGSGSPLLAEAIRQLAAWFAGTFTAFDLPVEYGTGLNAQVRRAMAAIPSGHTRTCGDLARELRAPLSRLARRQSPHF